MPIVYIAGPMRGLPEFNYPAFDAAAARLRAEGYTVFSPAEMDRKSDTPATDPLPPDFMRRAMERDCAAICKCDAVVLLPGWQASKGVAVEKALANLLGIKCMHIDQFLQAQPQEVS